MVLGLTAVVPIRNRDAWSVMQARFLGSSLAKSLQEEFKIEPDTPPVFASPKPHLRSCSFAGQRIFHITTSSGFAGYAWCATDRELIVAMAPQNIMAYLQHGPAHESMGTAAQVSRSIESADAPSMLVYVDTAKLFELAYPFVALLAPYGMGAFGTEGQLLPLDAIPSAPAIRRHLVPGTAALRRTKQGLELISRQPLPATGLLWTAEVAVQSPQSLEQQIAAEDRPRTEQDPFWGRTTVPAPAPAPPAVAQLEPAPAGTTFVPGPAGSTAPLPGVAGPVAWPPPPANWDPYAPPGATPPAAPPGQGTEGSLYAIGLGVKAYRNKHSTMPPAYLADKQGKPLLSWRVALLPYLGQQDLYQRFHLDEPWDSPHNRQLIPLIPYVYQDLHAAPAKDAPAKSVAGKTRYLLLRGPKTVYAEPTPPMPRVYEEWVKVIVVQVVPERAVPWTKPEEFSYDVEASPYGRGEREVGQRHHVDGLRRVENIQPACLGR